MTTSGATDMTLERFLDIIAAYGSRAEHWPAAERDSAERFCAQNASAMRARADARALDDAMDAGAPILPNRALELRILNGFQARSQRRVGLQSTWLGRGAIAASLAVSLTAGWLVLRPQGSDVDLSDQASWEVLGDDLEFAAANGEEKTIR